MPQSHNPEINAFIDVLADTGSHYRMDEMEALYTQDLGFWYQRSRDRSHVFPSRR